MRHLLHLLQLLLYNLQDLILVDFLVMELVQNQRLYNLQLHPHQMMLVVHLELILRHHLQLLNSLLQREMLP